MNLLNRDSLALTLDAVSDALGSGRGISRAQRLTVAKWIASRQGLPGAYADSFAPTETDRRGIRLFTGEAAGPGARTRHIVGEESCRVLAALDVGDRRVEEALARAVSGLATRIEDSVQRGYRPGTYCCGFCTAAYWRNLANGLLPKARERLPLGLAQLSEQRIGDGKWRRFPFFYTCLALTEIGPALARTEMQYAATHWRKIMKRLDAAEDSVARRRAALGQRLLGLCDA